MATALALELEPETSTGTDIAIAVTKDPGIVLLDREKFDAWYDKLSAKAPTDADVTTKKGRDALRSFAAEVRSEKAGIDKARLSLTKRWRDMTSSANTAGKEIEERLEKLAADVRAPLTQWEEAEKAKNENRRRIIDEMRAFGVVTMDDTSQTVRDRGSEVFKTEVTPELYEEMFDEAASVKAQSIETLKSALARLIREEADREELAKLRADREAAEAEAAEKAAAEQEERDKADAERIEKERREAAEQAEKDRIAAAEKAATERAQREAEERHEAELAAERAKTREAERVAQAERDRIENERLEAEATAKRLADEQAERETNKANRTAKKTAAKQAIMTCGVSEDAAQKVVLAIIAGEIPAVSLAF